MPSNQGGYSVFIAHEVVFQKLSQRVDFDQLQKADGRRTALFRTEEHERKKKAYRHVKVCVCACVHTHAIILSALNLLAFKDEKKKMYVCTQVNKVLLEQITQH